MPGLIRLVKNFDLAKDVFTRIPPNRLKGVDGGTLTFQASRFAIVGHEKTGDILVSYDGYDHTPGQLVTKKTFIDLYTPRTKELIDIYRHESLMTCVGATISEHRSLLAFTVLIRSNSSDRNSGSATESKDGVRKSRKKDFLFHSYIAEVRDKGMLYKLTIREGIVQRVQFLYVDKSRIVYLLFFLEGLFVHLYQVPTRHRQGGVEITAQPNLVSVVVKQFLWFEWDRQRSCLYVLQKSKQQNSLSASTGNVDHQNSPSGNKYQCKTSESKLKHCVLQCYHFPDKAYRQTWEIPLLFHITRPPSPSSSSSSSSSNSQSSPSPSSSSEPSFYHGLDHRARSSFSRYIHLVRLNGNGYCLCQQHPTVDDLASSIKVSLYLLHDKGKIDITIPMNNYDHQTIAKTRVFFGPIGSMVLIYIPSIYIQLVDCGAFHPPYPGLLLTGDHSTKLPEVKMNKNEEHAVQQLVSSSQGMGAGIGGLPTPIIGGGSNHISTGLVIPFSSDADASEMSGHLMLDCVGGVCYEYLLDREAILNIFTSHSGQSHIQALHLAIVHMQDNELVDQILTYLCRNYPANIVTPLLREFLIGAPYLKAKQTQNVPPQLFSIMPMTSQTPFSVTYSPNRLDMVYSELKGYYVLPNATRLVIKEKEQPRIIPRFQHDILIGPDQRYIDLPIINPPNRVTNLIKSFLTFVQPEAEGNSELDVDDENSSLTRASHQLMEAVANHIVNCYQRVVNKPQAIAMAKSFRKLIVDQTNRVYQTIIRTIEADGKRTQAMVLYQVLESLYCALEELSYPSPRGFSRSFVDYGQQCLPRSVFLQYIERDIFCLDVAFVEKIVSQLSDSTEDKLFKYELISNLKNRNQSIELMSKHHEYIDYLLQYYLSSFTLRISKDDVQQAANYEQTGDSPFIPRDVFLQAIRTRFVSSNSRDSRGTNTFIAQNEPRLHRNLIDYANEHATMESAKDLADSLTS